MLHYNLLSVSVLAGVIIGISYLRLNLFKSQQQCNSGDFIYLIIYLIIHPTSKLGQNTYKHNIHRFIEKVASVFLKNIFGNCRCPGQLK